MSAPGFPATCTTRLGWALPDDVPLVVDCDQPAGHRGPHSGNWRHGYGDTGVARITWDDTDRRTFHGDFTPCPATRCVLPGGHRGAHAR